MNDKADDKFNVATCFNSHHMTEVFSKAGKFFLGAEVFFFS